MSENSNFKNVKNRLTLPVRSDLSYNRSYLRFCRTSIPREFSMKLHTPKPMSNILSASSKTKYVTRFILRAFPLIISISLPGVAMTTCHHEYMSYDLSLRQLCLIIMTTTDGRCTNFMTSCHDILDHHDDNVISYWDVTTTLIDEITPCHYDITLSSWQCHPGSQICEPRSHHDIKSRYLTSAPFLSNRYCSVFEIPP